MEDVGDYIISNSQSLPLFHTCLPTTCCCVGVETLGAPAASGYLGVYGHAALDELNDISKRQCYQTDERAHYI